MEPQTPHDISLISAQYRAALTLYLAHEGPAPDLQPALVLGARAVEAGLDTLDVAKIHDLAMHEILPADVTTNVRNATHLRAALFFTEAITPIESTHHSALEAKRQIAALSETFAQNTAELADSHRELQEGISVRKAAEAALQLSRDSFEALLQESRLLERHLQDVAHQALSGQEAERRRLSNQLQDEIAQTILGIHVRLLVLKKEVAANQEGLSKEIVITQGLLEDSVETIHRLIREFGTPP